MFSKLDFDVYLPAARLKNGFVLAILVLVPALTLAQTSPDTGSADSLDACKLIVDSGERLACYDDFATPADTKSELADQEGTDSGVTSSLLEQYMAAEKAIFSFSGSFVGHRPMYILPFSYLRNANREPFSPRTGVSTYDFKLDNQEAKYQISFKVPLMTGLLDGRTTLWFGYTQTSFWQVYNTDDSAPFRETNFKPEIFIRYAPDFKIGPGALSGLALGLNHESNGQSEPSSRSWNRIQASVSYSYDRWLFMVQPWYRLPESDRKDDNPDIQRYLGYANYVAAYRWTENRTLSLRLMNNLRSDNKTSLELGYSFPMGDTVKGYVQYYNGYGESLIDYNQRVQRIGIGIMLNDWL